MKFSLISLTFLSLTGAATIEDESAGTSKMVLGAQLPENPYTVDNMREAAALPVLKTVADAGISKGGLLFAKPGTRRRQAVIQARAISPTHRYVKITPKSHADLNLLLNLDDNDGNDIVLHDHPLDYEVIDDGDYFIEGTTDEDIFHPVYTLIPVGFSLPKSLSVQVLDLIHEPPDDGSEDDIEEAAIQKAGLDLSAPDARLVPTHERRLIFGRRYRPQGCVKVFNTNTGSYDPLRRAKISIGRLIWWRYVHTDDNGCFVSPKRYRGTVYIRLKWRSNVATIRKSLNEMFGLFVSDRLTTMSRSSNNRTYRIPLSDGRLWYKSTVHNGLVKYNVCAREEGIHKTVQNANVWVWENGSSSGAAPMLHKFRNLPTMATIAGFTQANVWKGIVNGLFAMAIRLVPSRLRPDLIFSGLGKIQNTHRIDQLVFHESGHFSHASNAGSWFWAKMFSAEVTNIVFQSGDPYSDGTKPSLRAGSQIGLGEGWATLTEHRCMYKVHGGAYTRFGWRSNVAGYLDGFRMNQVPMTRNANDQDGWFLHGLMWDVLDYGESSSSRFVERNAAATFIGMIDDSVSIPNTREMYPIFRYLNSQVYNACDLGNKLVGGYPSKGPAISDLFASYGFDCVRGGTVPAPTPPTFPTGPSPTFPTPFPTPKLVKDDGCITLHGQRICK